MSELYEPFRRHVPSDELRDAWSLIRAALAESTRVAHTVYEEQLRRVSPQSRRSLEHAFGPTMAWIENGRMLEHGAGVLAKMAEQYASARRVDRRRFVSAGVDGLENLAAAATGSRVAASTLDALSLALPRFVLSNTAAQQLTCKLAIYLGMRSDPPQPLVTTLIPRLLGALVTILEVGAPATRDIAIEAAGALLKHCDDPEQSFPVRDFPEAEMKEGDKGTNKMYVRRWKRRRTLALAVAGHKPSCTEIFDDIESELAGQYDRRAELLRILPAMARQHPSDEMRNRVVSLLQHAAAVAHDPPNDSADLQAAFARYQESVFRTIELLLERGTDPEPFDGVVAQAVHDIPQTVVGRIDHCNARVRATVAILCTAAHVAARLKQSDTDEALAPWFLSLRHTPSLWVNPGIIEGCLRGLPLLMWDREHDDWTRVAVGALFEHLSRTPDVTDLAATHTRLFANASFRRLLTTVTEHLHERFLEYHTAIEEELEIRHVEDAIRNLLSSPTVDNVMDLFAPRLMIKRKPEIRRGVSELVLRAAAFETELLYRNQALFSEWYGLSAPRQLLLTRILSAQLRALSHDARELARYPVLRQMYETMLTVTLDGDERQKILWLLLSAIPAKAAEAADADVQEFVEQRSTATAGDEDVNDLPGYVLAMVSDTFSFRLASDIARQVDLNLRRIRLDDKDFDAAIPLYQVMLRGPHSAIFEHLLPRMRERRDRDLALLFGRHVKKVRDCADERGAVRMNMLIAHINEIVPELEANPSEILHHLAAALRRYVNLAATDHESIWSAIRGVEEEGGLHELFVALDTVAAHTRLRRMDGNDKSGAPHPNRRQPLQLLCKEECVQLRALITHYLDLPVNEFEQRRRALYDADQVLVRIEQKLERELSLQPPERILIVALLRTWSDLLRYTVEQWVDAPRRSIEARQPDAFWKEFVDPSSARARVPRFPGQAAAFERFYVDWMASELDMDHLRGALRDRWSRWFRGIYWVMGNFKAMIGVILFPCLVVAVLHSYKIHYLEGIAFAVYAFALFTATLLALSSDRRRRIALWFRRRVLHRETQPPRRGPQHRFQCLLPRLFRLIVVPLALIVDFEHSYHFPMHAFDVVLFVLMALAFVTTAFFVRREIRGQEHHFGRVNDDRERSERRKVRQIVAMALAHSFALALLFSILFEANTIDSLLRMDNHAARTESVGHIPDGHVGEAGKYHHADYLFGFLPREAHCNFAELLEHLGIHVAERYHSRLEWVFYPTLILTWTALGLFFGVFLEGFLKGERLREEIAK